MKFIKVIPLIWAIEDENNEWFIIMKITFIKVTPLIWAIQGQNNEAFLKVTPLIWAIEDPNSESFIKVTPLIWAIECQNNEALICISITGGGGEGEVRYGKFHNLNFFLKWSLPLGTF